MQFLDLTYSHNLKDEIFDIIKKRKNLIIYDDKSDTTGTMPQNVDYRFFYSSPNKPFEYVSIDIYGYPENLYRNNESVCEYGVMSIIRQKSKLQRGMFKCYFGTLEVKDEKIRSIPKDNIKLYINENGIDDIKGLIEFFEDNFCSRK